MCLASVGKRRNSVSSNVSEFGRKYFCSPGSNFCSALKANISRYGIQGNICVYYLFVNITRFDLYSVILFCCFYGGNRGKPTGKIHFSCLRVRSASLAETRICYQNNGGSNIS
jgi:hypothetical protein